MTLSMKDFSRPRASSTHVWVKRASFGFRYKKKSLQSMFCKTTLQCIRLFNARIYFHTSPDSTLGFTNVLNIGQLSVARSRSRQANRQINISRSLLHKVILRMFCLENGRILSCGADHCVLQYKYYTIKIYYTSI